MLQAAFLLLVLAIASCFDLRQRRIPNVLPIIVFAAGLLMLALAPQHAISPGGGASIVGLVLGAAALMPGYLLGALGAGDVKLMAASGFVVGWVVALMLIVMWALTFGVWCLAAVMAGSRRRQPAVPALFLAALLLGVSRL